MDDKQIEAYKYYKKLYPMSIILFHIGNEYVAIFNDAVELTNSQYPSSINENDMEGLSKLGDKWVIHIVEYRNEAGDFDYPDINLLISEQKKDY